MLDNLAPVSLARFQFAFTIAFHILFPSFTIGLASWLAVLEWRWLRTGYAVYEEVYRMWVKIFAVTFGMGVVSGVVMSFQFGTNWSVFSDHVGNVLGPLLGFEVFTAFFLEASFLGIMLFGWNRVGRKVHFAATLIVAATTVISAFWILAAVSWMHTPQGFRIAENGVFFPTSWPKIIFSPSFPYRFVHMIIATYLTTAFVVAGVGAFYLKRGSHVAHGRVMFGMAMIMAVLVSPLQLLVGDQHGLNTLKHQPAKIAAMEGLWETQRGAPLKLFGLPDQDAEATRYALKIPKLSSLILTHDLNGKVRGLKDWPKDERPPVFLVFWAFRLMVGLGLLMIAAGILGLILYFRKRLFDTPWFQVYCMALTPAGFLAVLAGWMVTELGRQPYIVYGLVRTAEAASPVSSGALAISIAGFVFVYTVIFGAGGYYILGLIKKGPSTDEKIYGGHGIELPPLAADSLLEKGGHHV